MLESSVGSIHEILKTCLNMCELTAKFMPHTCTQCFVLEFMANNKIAAIAHLPSSPDLAPCDFILFQNLKISLQGRRINDVSMTQAQSQDTLAEFHTTHVMKCSECWHDRWDCCIKGTALIVR
jgi:hypothetical protein